MEPDNIRTHGEMAIGKAQLGQRQTDIGYKIGACLWVVLAVMAVLFSFRNGTAEMSKSEFWGFQIVALLISSAVAFGIQKTGAAREHKRQDDLRRNREAEKQRQLDEFMKSKTT